MSTAPDWNLPPDFAPVRFPIPDAAKIAVRPLLGADEPVVVSLANDDNAIVLLGTPRNLWVIKLGALSAGAAGVNVRPFPWAGLERIVVTPLSVQLKFALHFRSSNGRTVEFGKRALLGKPFVENLAGFDGDNGQIAARALLQIWEHGRGILSGDKTCFPRNS